MTPYREANGLSSLASLVSIVVTPASFSAVVKS